jgi:hypothetical protein
VVFFNAAFLIAEGEGGKRFCPFVYKRREPMK